MSSEEENTLESRVNAIIARSDQLHSENSRLKQQNESLLSAKSRLERQLATVEVRVQSVIDRLKSVEVDQ